MEAIKIHISGAEATAVRLPVVTAGMVGLCVEFTFDSSWDGLVKSAVFRAGEVSRMREGIADRTVVDAEVLEQLHCELEIGVLGLDTDNSIVIPTVWASCGMIREGTAKDAQAAADPENPVWQQALDRLERVDDDIKTALQEAKDSGAFTGPKGEPGATGETPVRGVNYWTEEDKAEIKSYVDEAILGGAW